MTISALQNWKGATTASSVASLTDAYTSVPTSGNACVVFATRELGTGTLSISDDFGDSVSWIPIKGPIAAAAGAPIIIYGFYKVAGTCVGKTVTITNSTNTSLAIYVAEYQTSVAGTWALNGTATSASGTSTTPDPTGITCDANPSVVIGYQSNDGGTATAVVNWTRQAFDLVVSANSVEDRFVAAAATYDPSWTGAPAGSNWAAIGVALKSTASAASDQIDAYFEVNLEACESLETNGDFAAYAFYADAPLSSNDDVVTSHESFPATTDEPEWTDEALYPHYWSHAPPPADVWDPPSDNFVIDPYNYDDQDEPFGFTDGPLSASISTDLIVGEDSDGQLEDFDEDYGFADGQVPSDDLPQQGIYEDGQYSDPEDEPFGFYDAQVPSDDLPQQALTEDGQYFDPEDEPFDFQSAPLSDDGAPDQIWGEDSSNQLEEYLDEDFVFSDSQIPDDVTPVATESYSVRRSPHRRAVR